MHNPNLDQSDVPRLLPRDILSPAATFLGIILGSLGLVLGFTEQKSDFLNNFFIIIIISIILIILAAFFTVIMSLTQNIRYWVLARIFYGVSWLSLGIITIFILIGSIFELEYLQIQLSTFNTEFIVGSSTSISIFLTYLFIRHYEKRIQKELYKIKSSVQSLSVDKIDIKNKIENTILEFGNDNIISYEKLIVDFEQNLRDIIDIPRFKNHFERKIKYTFRDVLEYLIIKGYVSKDVLTSYLLLQNYRYEVVHNKKITDNEFEILSYVAATLLLEIEELKDNLIQK